LILVNYAHVCSDLHSFPFFACTRKFDDKLIMYWIHIIEVNKCLCVAFNIRNLLNGEEERNSTVAENRDTGANLLL
jgi:hypothetical protein